MRARASTTRVAVGAVAVLLAAAACGSGEDAGPTPATTTAAEEGGGGAEVGAMHFGECGSVGTEEVSSITGHGGLQLVELNSVGCRWEGGGLFGGHGSFSWYRGSPILRERTLVERAGRTVEDLDIAPMRGYVGWTAGLCEVGQEFGDDFFVWSVVFPEAGAERSICDPVIALAELTVERSE